MKLKKTEVKFCAASIFGVFLFLWQTPVEAAVTFTITQTSPPPPANLIMRSTVPITFHITNTDTGGDVGKRIFQVTFSLTGKCTGGGCTATAFSSATAAPAGWTLSTFSAKKIVFLAGSWNNAIATVGNGPTTAIDFTLTFIAGTSTVDVSETLQNAVAAYTSTTTGPPFGKAQNMVTIKNTGSWNLRALSMTLAASPTSVTVGNTLTLTMTVTNDSSATLSGLVSGPAPPTLTSTASGFTLTLASGPTPASLSLTVNQTNTIVWTYTVGLAAGKTCPTATPGTVTFTAQAKNGPGTATSGPAMTTTPVSIGCFTASLSGPSCAAPGGVVTVTMTVNNFNSTAMNSLRNATLSKDAVNSTASGTATCGSPSYSSTTAPANNGSPIPTVTWSCTLPSTASAGQTYIFQGQVTGTLAFDSNTYTTPLASSNTLTFGAATSSAVPNPATVTAGSMNVLIIWAVSNNSCGAVPLNNVKISLPSGWTYLSSASTVNGTDDWTDAPSGSPTNLVTYAAGTALPVGASGAFVIVFSQVPTTQNPYSFNVHLTDTGGGAQDVPTTVTVGPATVGGVTDSNPIQEITP